MEGEFKLWMPLDIVKADGKEMRIGGIASDETAEDLQNEVVKVEGLDIDYLLKRGAFNWNHGKGPEDILGEVDKAEKIGGKLYVEGILYPHVKRAKYVYDLIRSLRAVNSKRKLGLSLEGKVQEREGNVIKKAWIKNVAVTYNPINQGTWVDMVKSLTEGLETEEELKERVETLVGLHGEELEKAGFHIRYKKGDTGEVASVDIVARTKEEAKKIAEEKYGIKDEDIVRMHEKEEKHVKEEEEKKEVGKALAAGYDIPATSGGVSGSALRTESLEPELKITTYDGVGRETQNEEIVEEAKEIAERKRRKWRRNGFADWLRENLGYSEQMAKLMADMVFRMAGR